jgi:hypothetical protein
MSNTKNSIFARRYISGTWEASELLETDDVNPASSPQIAIDTNGNAFVVWQQKNANKNSIFARRYISGTWGASELLEADDTNAALDPQVAFDASGNAIAVWHQIANSVDSIFANRYVSGTGWEGPQLLETDDANAASQVQIAMDADGNGIAVWSQNTGTVYSIFANRYVSGTGWEGPQLLETDDAGAAEYPQIAIDANGNAIAVWSQNTGTVYSIFANRYVSGTGWEGPQLLEMDDDYDAYDPQIAIDANGNAIAVWQQFDGTRYNIWANRFE